MPITFPAHAAAILPFVGTRCRRLPGTALLVGSAAPDFAFAATAELAVWSHSALGVLLFGVPVGLALYGALDGVVLPAVRASSGILERALPGRRLARAATEWMAALAAVLIGALTHVGWDSVTHADRWPGTVLFTESQAALSHLVCSYAGSLVVLGWGLARYWRGATRHGTDARALIALLAGGASGVIAAIVLSRLRPELAGHLARGWLYFLGGFTGLLLACWALRGRSAHQGASNSR